MPNKIIDLEVLKSFRQRLDNRYVQQVGYIPGLHVGIADLAKQIENVSEESGTTQTKSFTLQATATDSNTTSTPTAPLAKHLELRGNSVVFNQLCIVPTIQTQTVNDVTITNNGDGSVTISGTASADTTFDLCGNLTRDIVKKGHKYLITNLKNEPSNTKYYVYDAYDSDITNDYVSQPYGYVKERTGSTQIISPRIRVRSGAHIEETIYIQYFDLTAMFNGNIPTEILNGFDIELGDEDETILHISSICAFNQLFREAYYSYNAGEIKSCESTKLTTIGYNQFDEEIEGNSWSTSDESGVTDSDSFRSKNFIKVIAGQMYSIGSALLDGTTSLTLLQYNGNKELISYSNELVEDLKSYVLNEETQYIRFAIYKSGSGWASNIPTKENAKCFINLTWDKSKTGYEEYSKEEYTYPSLVLNSAGDVYDELTPNGTLIRRIGSYTFTGEENITLINTDSETGYVTIYISCLNNTGKANSKNVLCPLAQRVSYNSYVFTHPYTIYIATTSSIEVNMAETTASATLQALVGKTIYYELATPTTTQNDAYAYTENIVVDDFGTMEFNSDIPQGNKFFYPADYVLLLDDLNNYVNGDVTELAKKSDIPSADFSSISESVLPETTNTYDLGSGTYTWKELYLSGKINPNSSGYGLKPQDTSGYTADKEIATTDYFGFRKITATDFNNLTAQEKAKAIYKGLIIEGTITIYNNVQLKNPTFYPMIWNGYNTDTTNTTKQGVLEYSLTTSSSPSIVRTNWRIQENLVYRITISDTFGRIDLRNIGQINEKSVYGSVFYSTLSSSNIGSITSTTISTGWYKNVIAISGGLTNAKDVKVKMSNGYTYTPTGFSASEIVIFSGVDFSGSSITVDTLYYKDN